MTSQEPLKAARLEIHWHDNNLPVYSVDFQRAVKGGHSPRLATGGGDNNIRIWRPIYSEDGTSIKSMEYLSTLAKHTQAVNVVRFDPKGELLASASDDGTVMIWHLSDTIVKVFGAEDDDEVKESWLTKHTYRNSTSEVYDLSWSPDSKYITVGSMDNVIRIYNVATGQQVKQIAEHNHYVQGVTWDPRNEYIASQSADRSVHIYKLNASADGLSLAPTTYFKITKGDIPTHRITNPPLTFENLRTKDHGTYLMEPPHSTHKRRLSSSSTGSNTTTTTTMPARSMSPSPSIQPLPAVRPMDPPPGSSASGSYRSSSLYHNDTLQSFFRRLSFSPDGSLLLTASGIFRTTTTAVEETEAPPTPDYSGAGSSGAAVGGAATHVPPSTSVTTMNTVYIHTRAGLNRSPVAHLVGLKKPAIAIRFSNVIYKLIQDEASEVINLPYRMIFAVATQNSVVIYDTQRVKPLGYVSNIHYAVITDICFSNDGKTLVVSSADGFCSYVIIADSLLGEPHEDNLTNLMKRTQPLQQLQSPVMSPPIAPNPTTVMELLQLQPEKSSSIEVIDITEPSSFDETPPISAEARTQNMLEEDKEKEKEKKKKRRVAPTLVEKKE
ncbi:unnamed protein product [Kuraishia capsulata CBS 1993]|uniref:CAF1B/HIR1 beta-propeller domain-containing protein n=1 Tax=Kuraishia capsulata CBS 1993 TaxID=1382522 RepID=W6MLT8_9ASCO|nr:uncharacterized protein KUCA_T00003080001 [Kuraishia capsulata CBS 1993]CDK27103.1 unnamed protein product [Kuraishia capsulata CBS 1993]